MKAHEYVDTVVSPLYAAFKSNGSSMALFYASVVTTYHAVDYIAAECGVKSLLVETRINRDVEHFHLLHSVAVARKHINITAPHLRRMTIDDVRGPARAALIRSGKTRTRPDGAMIVRKIGFSVTVDGGAVSLTALLSRSVRYLQASTDSIVTELMTQPVGRRTRPSVVGPE